MKKIAFIFPGQGSQSVGMGKNLYDNFSLAKEIFDSSDAILNKNNSKLCFEGPDELLKQTINSQSAIVTTSIAALEVFKHEFKNIAPDFVLGHSLGEYCAMYCAGVLDFKNTLLTIQKRADYMNEATIAHKGSMVAIIGAKEEDIKEALSLASKTGIVSVANYNTPVQVVLSGELDPLNKACSYLKEKKSGKIIPLAVSGGFHGKLMNLASEKFEKYIENIKISNANIPVITNIDAKETIKSEDFKIKMPKQINSSVMWVQSIEYAISRGVEIFIEFGNGKVLSGLNRKISQDIITYNMSDVSSLQDLKENLMAGV